MIIAGKGTQLQHDVVTNPSGTPVHTYTSVAQVVSINPAPLVMGTRDNTNLGDTCKKTASTVPDPGETVFHIQFDPASTTHALLITMFNAGSDSTDGWRILYNDQGTGTNPSKETFDAWVKQLSPAEINIDGNVEMDVTLQLTTVPVFTARS